MPKAIKESLQPSGLTEDKSTSVDVGKGGVNVGVDKGHHHSGGTNVNVGGNKGGVNVNTPGGTHVGVGKGGVGVTTPGHHGKPPVSVGVHPGPSPFLYNYAAKDDQLNDNPNVALFFLEKDLHEGSNMKLKFVENGNGASFLPRQEADSIPFSSEKMPEILHKFSVDEDSEEGQIMKQTVTECEEPGIKGEEKYCATSLESMIDFTTSKLGNKVQPLSTETQKENTEMQKYTILGAKKMGKNNDKSVVCHKQNYAYAVFYCHKTETTESYMVSLVGVDGTKVKAVAVCHKDTSQWNPKHLALKFLRISLLAYSPLAMGILSGKYFAEDGGSSNARLNLFKGRYKEGESRYDLSKSNVLYAAKSYLEIACRYGIHPVSLAIAFIMRHPLVASVVFGATKVWQLEEVLAACKVNLSPEIITEINKVHSRFPSPCP